jgi:hypothetical protein
MAKHHTRTSWRRFASALSVASAALALPVATADAAPPIRSSSANPVPACVTPERLMAFLNGRNDHLDPRFRDIARWYKHYGEAWRVRWDYAFFQMAIETNFLKFRRGDGRRGDVSDAQNNFAGIGATGGGVPGERFADVATGVHAQIQHLVAYSGERLAQPIAKRTRERQGDIIDASQRLGRPVTFGDLARRWAVDRAYGKSIDYIANLYQTEFCNGGAARSAEGLTPPAPQPAHRERNFQFPPPSGLGGPKPQNLAGPEPQPDGGEQLPWLVPKKEPAAPAAKTKTKAKAGAKANPEKKTAKAKSQIKTIWSRPDANTKSDPGAASPSPQASPATAQGEAAADTNAAQKLSAAGDSSLPTLPTFRIAPLGTTPSRLGGPVPADPSIAARAAAPSRPSAPCRVLTASYGGTKTLLVRSSSHGETRYTALTVLDGFEKSMFDTYSKAEASGAEIVGEYPNPDEALADARVNCPDE